MKSTSYMVIVMIAACLLSACGDPPPTTADRRQSQSAGDARKADMSIEVTYDQLFVGADGETHFRQIRVPVISEQTSPPAQPFPQSALQPATSIRHVAFPPHWGVYDRDH